MSVKAQDMKYVALFGASVASNATTLGTVDTLGYDYASIVCQHGTETTNPQTMRILEGTNSSVATEVTAFVGDTAFTIPAVDTDDGIQVLMHIDLRDRERYLGLEVQAAGASAIMSGIAILSRAGNAPITDAERVGPGAVEVITG